MGGSSSKAISDQKSMANLFQSYQGSCDITCNNIIDGASITIINDNIGGDVKITQSCSVDGSCSMNNSLGSLSDVSYNAKNSSNANNPFLSVNISDAESKQDIKQTISNSVNQDCKISSTNQMTNVSIYAAGSNIGGNVEFTQDGKTGGQCVLKNTMTAAAYATGMSNNESKSGKDKKGSKKSSMTTIIIIFAVIAVMGILAGVLTVYLRKQKHLVRDKDGNPILKNKVE